MRRSKGSIIAGLILVILGAWYLLVELMPVVKDFAYGPTTWPYQIIALGLLFGLFAILTWTPALWIPASIITGIGGLLFYQNAYHAWESWSYAWTLIPGFVGVGLVLFGLLARKRGAVIGGLWNLVSAAILFSIFGYAFAQLRFAAIIWPAAIILVGLMFLVRALVGKKTA